MKALLHKSHLCRRSLWCTARVWLRRSEALLNRRGQKSHANSFRRRWMEVMCLRAKRQARSQGRVGSARAWRDVKHRQVPGGHRPAAAPRGTHPRPPPPRRQHHPCGGEPEKHQHRNTSNLYSSTTPSTTTPPHHLLPPPVSSPSSQCLPLQLNNTNNNNQ